jgi:hypothetical protein
MGDVEEKFQTFLIPTKNGLRADWTSVREVVQTSEDGGDMFLRNVG